jgi:hypothetical protein
MMKKFELCYEIDRETLLLPTLLSIEEPSISIPSGETPLRFSIEYEFLPKSLLPRLIVRMHNDIDDALRWRSGVVLRSENIEARAILKADEMERRISIAVYGPHRRDYLGIILHTLRSINRSFKRMNVVEIVQMPDRPDIGVSYPHLLRLEAKGIPTYMPDGTDKEYSVRELLGYVKAPRKTEEEILELLRLLVDRTDTAETLYQKANSALLLHPNLFGIGVNLNELIRRVLPNKGPPHR